MILRIVEREVDEAALVVVRAETYMVRLANDEVSVSKSWATEEHHLYLAKGKKYAIVSSTGELDISAVEDALRRLSSLPEDPLYVPLKGEALPTPREEREEDFEALADVALEAARAAEGAERNAGAAVLTYVSFQYEDTYGRRGRYSLNRAYLTIRSLRGDLAATSATAGRSLADLRPREVGEANSLLLRLAAGLPREPVQPGRARLLLSPLVFGHLLGETVGGWMTGTAVISGSSRYSPQDLGAAVASSELSVADATADERAYGHTPFDFEGNRVERVQLLERGVLKAFLQNNRTAAKLGGRSTGHALRSWIYTSPGHVEAKAGDAPSDLEGLIAELKSGYYVHNNWYTRYQNIKTGQFSTVGRDVILAVRDGKPVAVVRHMRIADTLEALLRNTAALSSRASQIYWWDMSVPATVPYAIVDGLGVTK
ncbi:TldD/PmbA family protein [Thermoproteus tenax]|uniref:Modulator of DNA gyrase, family U62 peptidase n=1 Tax=Thermoproteus tenax (strain ATCC 35583 / DSM 2078 / JCM 9277 / NBRC 100435 / Kra 1) TaxID=768679 RepID=G4RN29_THETK|nr:TldD/PmbA family protein [Thermoproteus tenax]CCC80973.1 modulator of DNA gyrase, family U62 peptidase [Thermoproteus tenax Kra 1]